MPRTIRFVVVVAAALVLAACAADAPPTATDVPSPLVAPDAPPPSATADPPARPAGDPVVVATGLEAPWSAAPLADGTQLVSERGSGTILEIAADGATRRIGTVPGVAAGGEGGLHGLAVSPDGTWLYAYHGTTDDNRVVRMPLAGSAGSRSLGRVETVFEGIPRAGNHNGGRLAFGPDGFLYVTTGDAGLRGAAQDPGSAAGKILRLAPDGTPAPGNPSGTAVFSLGHRNVQGLAWTADGTMWASEFGQDTFDEVNRIEPGGNYGWPLHEGAAGEAGYLDPVVTWATDEASPSGMAAAGRTLFVASLRGERVWMVDVEGGAVVGAPHALWVGEFGRIRDAVVQGGALWLLTNNTDGRGSPAAEDDRLLRVPLASG
ncbi:PQQ-dependent sugar dehydrogenase [Microbacterium sp. RD1]|uniref:PQQ-dependent sugar dehydrogenase n=1 Tax=Microbacterium sp. RD1 TaxID=3457313 RepID=UPI003FA5CED1